MTRIPNRTAHIKPATREALMDQLALAASAQMILREQLDEAEHYADLLHIAANEKWWHRFAWWRK